MPWPTKKAPSSPRAAAARAIAGVMSGMNFDHALQQAGAADLTPQDLSLLKAIGYGVVREHRLLAEILSKLLSHPLKNEPEINALMLAGLFQLRSMRVAPHAAVGETVAAVTLLGKDKLRGLVNAVLRRYQREHETLEAALPVALAVRLSYPDWLSRLIQADWPENAGRVLEAGNQPGPLTLRVNRRKIGRDGYLDKLTAAGIAAQTIEHLPDALVLESALGVESIPGFASGEVSVQDASAQLAAGILGAEPGMRVLDACAAPGGKTAHLLERCDDLYVMAMDVDEQRIRRVEDNLARLALEARIVTGDAGDPPRWWDGNPFERILLDAPCSGTGVIRRHPDIKWLRRETDIPKMAAVQKGMLQALWPLLSPGGALVYATCSVLKAEGEDVVKHFLISNPDAKHVAIDAGWGEARSVGRRIAPGGNFDGFYYAKLVKR